MTEPKAELSPIARWLHNNDVGCKRKPSDPFDHGMPWEHTGDHEAAASELVVLLRDAAERMGRA